MEAGRTSWRQTGGDRDEQREDDPAVRCEAERIRLSFIAIVTSYSLSVG
jgi:hypothetical protein